MVRFLSEPLHESHYSESWFITLLTLSELRYGDYTSCQTRKFSGKVFNSTWLRPRCLVMAFLLDFLVSLYQISCTLN